MVIQKRKKKTQKRKMKKPKLVGNGAFSGKVFKKGSGTFSKSVTERFMTIKNNTLLIYNSEKDYKASKKSAKKIELSGTVIEKSNDNSKKKYWINIKKGKKIVKEIALDSKDDRDKWISALQAQSVPPLPSDEKREVSKKK